MIPKILHYCWFGGNPKSEVMEKCIASWKRCCPDWEIREWNESNFDVSAMPYTQEAYDAKKWAFVSDVARLHAVYECGGVYLDTDVELLQSIDDWCRYDAVYAFETDLNIATGLGFAAVAHHDSVKSMLDFYRDRHFLKNGKPNLLPCPKGNTDSLRAWNPGFQPNGMPQELDGVRVLSGSEYAQFAKNHASGTWIDAPSHKKKEFKDTRLKRFLRKPSKFLWIEKKLGKKPLAIYTFIAYDLLEMGPWYYVKRKFRRK